MNEESERHYIEERDGLLATGAFRVREPRNNWLSAELLTGGELIAAPCPVDGLVTVVACGLEYGVGTATRTGRPSGRVVLALGLFEGAVRDYLPGLDSVVRLP